MYLARRSFRWIIWSFSPMRVIECGDTKALSSSSWPAETDVDAAAAEETDADDDRPPVVPTDVSRCADERCAVFFFALRVAILPRSTAAAVLSRRWRRGSKLQTHAISDREQHSKARW